MVSLLLSFVVRVPAGRLAWSGRLAYDAVPQHADVGDLDLDDVARLQPDRRLALGADAAWGAGGDYVTWGQSREARDVGDGLSHRENHVPERRGLHDVAVDPRLDLEVL